MNTTELSPYTGKPMTLVQEHRVLTYKNEQFTCLASFWKCNVNTVIICFWKCEDTGELFTDAAMDEALLAQVHSLYKLRHTS